MKDRTTYQILYPYHAQTDKKKYIVGSNRNPILASLCDSGTIFTEHRLDKTCNFFWGWNVEFKYREKNFRWTWDNKLVLVDTEIKRTLSEDETKDSITDKLDDMLKNFQ